MVGIKALIKQIRHGFPNRGQGIWDREDGEDVKDVGDVGDVRDVRDVKDGGDGGFNSSLGGNSGVFFYLLR
jgi:hypothetical protein